MASSSDITVNPRAAVGVPTTMRVAEGEDWPTPEGARFRRVGWLDQRGRVWTGTPSPGDFDGGSLTPLLVQIEDD